MAKKICRTCLKYTVLSFKTHDTLNNPGEPGQLKISDVLRYLVPELYLGVTTNPEICFECRGAIRSAYKFRKQCLSTENLIGSYLKNARCTARSVDLYEVLEFLENTPAAKPANANISDQNQSAPETYAQKIISDWEDEASEESNVEVLSHSENKTTKETVAENISANAVETLTGNKEQISESGEKSQNKNIRVRTNLFRIDNVFTLFDDEFKDNSKINEKVQKQNSEGVSKEKLFSQEDSHTQTLKKLLEQPKILTPLDNLSNQPISSRKMLADLLKSSDKEQNKKLNSNTVDDCLLNIKEEPLDVDINKDLENSSATANDEDTLTAPESVAYDDIQGLINNIPNAYNNQYVDVPDFVQINNFSMTDFEELRKLQEPQTIANQLIPLQPGTFSVAGSTLVQPTQNKIFHTIVNSKPLLSPGNNITFTNLDLLNKPANSTNVVYSQLPQLFLSTTNSTQVKNNTVLYPAKKRKRKKIKLVPVGEIVDEEIPENNDPDKDVCVLFTNYTDDGVYVNDHDYLVSPYKRNKILIKDDNNWRCMCYICSNKHPVDEHVDHMLTHEATCSLCSISFGTPYMLNMHIRSHEKPCKFCTEKVQFADREKHELKHLEEDREFESYKVKRFYYARRGRKKQDKDEKPVYFPIKIGSDSEKDTVETHKLRNSSSETKCEETKKVEEVPPNRESLVLKKRPGRKRKVECEEPVKTEIETSVVGKRVLRSAVKKGEVETAVKKADVETAVEKAEVETAVKKDEVETAVKTAEVETKTADVIK